MATLQIIKLERDDFDEWNRFVDLSPQGDVFCYSWWLDAVTKSRFTIYAIKEHDEIVAGMPLAFDRFGRINEPYLTRTLGILYKNQQKNSDRKRISNQRKWASCLIDKIPLDDFVQTCTHHNFIDWLPYRWKGFNQTTRYTYLLFYEGKSLENLGNKLAFSCRKAIRKAQRNNIRAEESQNFEELYYLVLQSYKRQGLSLNIPYSDFKILDDAIRINGRRLIMIARDVSGNPHAGTYIAFNRNSAYYLLSGSNPELRALGGHILAVWESIKYFSDKVSYLNFGGSDIQRIEQHIKGFGGVLTPYFHIFNLRKLHSHDIRFHIRSIFEHSSDIAKALRYKYLKM